MLPVSLQNIQFGFYDDSGLRDRERILIFYSFETEDHLSRSGILHYHTEQKRFLGPCHDTELTSAAIDFLSENGRLRSAAPEPQ